MFTKGIILALQSLVLIGAIRGKLGHSHFIDWTGSRYRDPMLPVGSPIELTAAAEHALH